MASGYKSIADDLRAAIHRGDYPARSFLPAQAELAQHYQVAELTIRRAVALLNAEGLIVTTRRGSEVRPRDPVRLAVTRFSTATPTEGSWENAWETACAAQGYDGVTVVLAVEQQPAPDAVATYLGIPPGSPVVRRDSQMRIAPPGSPVVRRDSQMRIGNRVLQLQTTWIPLVRADIYGELLAAGYQPATASEVVTGRMPTKDEADALGLPLGHGRSVLDVQCTTFDRDGKPIMHAQLVVAADRISLAYSWVTAP